MFIYCLALTNLRSYDIFVLLLLLLPRFYFTLTFANKTRRQKPETSVTPYAYSIDN